MVEGRWERQERKQEVDQETKGETGKKRIREEEKEENETLRLLTFLVKGRIGRAVALTRTVVPVVLVVTDVLVSLSSVVTEVCDGFSLGSDWEFVEPQSFSFSHKRSFACAENQGEMSCEGTPVKAPPSTRTRVRPPTPQQNSHSVASGSGGTTKYLEHSGKTGNCGNGELPGQKCRYESGD